MLRPSLAVITLVLSLVCPVGVQAAGGLGAAGVHLVAVYQGRLLGLDEVPLHHCHDRASPVIRCFDTERERDQDAGTRGDDQGGSAAVEVEDGRVSLSTEATLSLAAVTYVLWYEHSNYKGASFSASGGVGDLGLIGWSDRISSFKSTNGGRPKWWDGTYYSGSHWQWGTSAWVAYVGNAANDRFTSVFNVP